MTPNVQLIAAINDLIDHIEAGAEPNVLMQIALVIKQLVEAGGGES